MGREKGKEIEVKIDARILVRIKMEIEKKGNGRWKENRRE